MTEVRAVGPAVVLGAAVTPGASVTLGGTTAGGAATVVPSPGGAGSLDELSDVTTTGAITGQVLVRGDDGVWYPQTPTAAPAWGDAVAFADNPPDPTTAPASAVWVELGSMTIYRKAP